MAIFSDRISRLGALLVAVGVFWLVPPERFAQGPDLCLWRHLFHLAACPACGSTRALAAFFHGRFAAALAFNRNVVVTGPGLALLMILDVVSLLRSLGLPKPLFANCGGGVMPAIMQASPGSEVRRAGGHCNS